MDIKFILILAVVVIVSLLLHDFKSFKKTINRKLIDIENKFNIYNQDFSNIVKREALMSNNKFKTYTSEMIQQIRKMNKIENEQVTLISDGFDDDGLSRCSNRHIPYLSDSNQINTLKLIHNDRESLYMSETENENIYIVKDNNDNILNSSKIITTKNASNPKISDNNSERNVSSNNTHTDKKCDNNSRYLSSSSSESFVSSVKRLSSIDNNINDLKIIQNDMDNSINDSIQSKQHTENDLSSNNIVDGLSLCTADDNSSMCNKKQNSSVLYSIGRYTKADLIEIAKQHNITVPDKINKDNLYATIKNNLNL